MTDIHPISRSATAAAPPPLPPRVQAYLEAIVRTCAKSGRTLASVILFGSAATGGFSSTVSDVDLLLVLPEGASSEDRRWMGDRVARLEKAHGFRKEPARPPGVLGVFVERVTANVRSFFVCTRGDLLSGDVARILDLRPSQAVFVDRVVVPSIVGSAITVWGDDLLPHVPLLPVRRFDVFKALFALSSQILLCAVLFPALPAATKYAMGLLSAQCTTASFAITPIRLA